MIASKDNNYLYNPKLKDKTRYLRSKGTKAEACLWKYALSSRIMGHKFLRQRPVMYYIVDFMCPELLLIIEVDGATHLLEGADKKDTTRQKKLEDAGFTVIRFEDSTVLNNMSWIQSYLAQEVARLAGQITDSI